MTKRTLVIVGLVLAIITVAYTVVHFTSVEEPQVITRSALTGSHISDTYKDLLQVSNSNNGVDGTLRTVSDGEGTDSALQLSTTAAKINGNLTVSGILTATTSELLTSDHDHSGDANDGGTFDAANLTSGIAGDGYVLTADGAGAADWEVVPTPHAAISLGVGSDPALTVTDQVLTLTLFTTDTPGGITPDDVAAAGSSLYTAHLDHTHAITAAVAGTIAPDDVAAEGSAGTFARSDHVHAITAAAAGNIVPDASAAEGDATSFSRSNHTHGIAAAAPASNLSISTTNAEGDATSFARSNHAHAITTSSNPGAAAAILSSDASGLLTVEGVGISETAQANKVILPSGGVISTTADNLTMAPAGDLITSPGGNDVLPETNYLTNIGSNTKKYLTLHVGELDASNLVADNTIATIGGHILVGPTTKLALDLGSGAGDTTITTEHNNLAVDDTVMLEEEGNLEYMLITDGPNSTGPYTYTVTRDRDGSGVDAWYAGDAVFNTGTTGDGFLELYSNVSLLADVGPSVTAWGRDSTTYNALTERAALGNLSGLYGYVADTYGVALGKSGSNYVTIDETNGLRMYGNGSQTFGVDTSGNLKLGSDVTVITTTALTVDAASGDLLMGATGAGQANVLWDRSEGTLNFRGDTTTQAAINSDGELTAGGGTVTLNSDGVSIVGADTTLAENNQVTFIASGTVTNVAHLGEYREGGINIVELEAEDDLGSHTKIDILANSATDAYARIGLSATSSEFGTHPSMYITANENGDGRDIIQFLDASVRIEEGLYVGSVAITPTTDCIAADGDIFANSGLRIGDTTTAPDDNTIEIEERSSDPGDPAEGNGILWLSDGTGQGGDGDLVWSRTFDGSTVHTVLTEGGGYKYTPGYYSSTSWDGDAYTTTTTIDLQAVFSVPAGIQAVSAMLYARDETPGVLFSADNGDGYTRGILQVTQVANTLVGVAGIVPCDANGDIRVYLSGELDEVQLYITGYYQ